MIKMIELLKNKKNAKMPINIISDTSSDIIAVVNEKYRCEIRTSDKKFSTESPVMCYCSCADFQFRWAYVLYKHGSLLNESSFVLEPPKEKNPGLKVGACKHLAALADKVLNENNKENG